MYINQRLNFFLLGYKNLEYLKGTSFCGFGPKLRKIFQKRKTKVE